MILYGPPSSHVSHVSHISHISLLCHRRTPPYWIGASPTLSASHLSPLRLDLRLVASRLAFPPGHYDGRTMSSCVACSETSQTSGACAIQTGARRRDREQKLTVSSYSMRILFGESPHHGSPLRFRQVVLRYTCHCSSRICRICGMTARLSGTRCQTSVTSLHLTPPHQ